MTDENFNLLALISAIGNLEDNNLRIYYYELNKNILQDYSMIFVDDLFGNDKTSFLTKIVDFDYDFNSLFSSNKLLCLNKEVLANKDKLKDTLILHQVCVQFDLNIISQLKYTNNANFSDNDLIKIINLCRSKACAFDNANFVLENYLKDINNLGLDSFALEDIKAFETLFPHKRFSYDRGVPINERMKELERYYNSQEFKKIALYLYDDIYITELTYLLAIIHIHFKYFKLSPKHKFENFLDFCNTELKAFHPCAENLAFLFYENPNLKFFKKIQKNNKNIIQTIENMSWDLFHLRFLEKSEEFSHFDTKIIMIPIFISKDKGLNEIRKAYQIKCLFKNLKTGECLPYYSMNTITPSLHDKYFSREQIKKRVNEPHNFKKNINTLKKLILDDINY